MLVNLIDKESFLRGGLSCKQRLIGHKSLKRSVMSLTQAKISKFRSWHKFQLANENCKIAIKTNVNCKIKIKSNVRVHNGWFANGLVLIRKLYRISLSDLINRRFRFVSGDLHECQDERDGVVVYQPLANKC